MSLYGVNCKVDGVPVGLVMRETYNGAYILVIEREKATLEQIEAINWDSPEIVSKPGETCILPVGYGFVLEDINYSNSDHTWKVKVSVGQQYLGDVTGYAAQVAEKDQQIAALQDAGAQKDRTISQQADQLSQQAAALTQKTTQISQQTSTIHQLEQQLAEADELAIALYEAQAAAAVSDAPDVPNEADGADEAVQGADETTEEV